MHGHDSQSNPTNTARCHRLTNIWVWNDNHFLRAQGATCQDSILGTLEITVVHVQPWVLLRNEWQEIGCLLMCNWTCTLYSFHSLSFVKYLSLHTFVPITQPNFQNEPNQSKERIPIDMVVALSTDLGADSHKVTTRTLVAHAAIGLFLNKMAGLGTLATKWCWLLVLPCPHAIPWNTSWKSTAVPSPFSLPLGFSELRKFWIKLNYIELIWPVWLSSPISFCSACDWAMTFCRSLQGFLIVSVPWRIWFV